MFIKQNISSFFNISESKFLIHIDTYNNMCYPNYESQNHEKLFFQGSNW